MTVPDLSEGPVGPVVINLPSTRCTPPVVGQLKDVLGTHPGMTEVQLRLRARNATTVLRLDDRESRTYFDLLYTDRPPATWREGVREAMEDGSLVFGLPADVREAGRYVVSARVVDAHGRPFALLGFNEEVGAGAQEFRLVLFGRLVRDVKPAFPVALRDVTAFLLQEDGFPDRRLLPRRDGTVHVSQDHPLEAFGEAEWSSEERSRYLDELGRDVARARAEVERLGP